MNRRRFFQTSIAAAACGFAYSARGAIENAESLIDTHVYVGHWPLRQLDRGDDPAALVRALRGGQVTQAWAGSFDGLFHKDIHGVNSRLAEACASAGGGLLIPFGTVNPVLPDWEEDVRRCHEVFRLPGIRLHPNYHAYTLADPRFARLLALAAERKLVVQLVASLTDAKARWLTPGLPRVDLAPLAEAVRPVSNLKLLVSGLRNVQDDWLRNLTALPGIYIDAARVADGNSLPADRIVFGSSAPLSPFESAVAKLELSGLPAEQLRAIRSENAKRLLGAR